MKNITKKKGLGIITLIALAFILSLNAKVLNTSNTNINLANLISLNTANAEIGPGIYQKDDLQRCRYNNPDGTFTSSVKIGCVECYLTAPFICECNPKACGEA